MKKSTLSSTRRCPAGSLRFSASMPCGVFGTYLLAQNHDTARSVPELYTASQARTCATVGVTMERTL